MKPDLTIGLAHFRDYDGVYFTLQSLRLQNLDLLSRIEFILVDNSPDSAEGAAVKEFFERHVAIAGATSQYVPLRSPIGTSISRQKIFDVATSDNVLVLDCHVLLPPAAIRKLLKWYEQHPTSRNIYSGPLVYDDMENFVTHFNDQWRAEMWGTWGSAWQCRCSEQGLRFSTHNENGCLDYRSVEMGFDIVTECSTCGGKFPEMEYPGHERQLISKGYRQLAANDNDEPFEVPGMGLGLFSCRKEAWPGFNEHARGFGGEELYIHEKVRRQGGKAICLPWLRWVHRFHRVHGVPYRVSAWNKIRNYVLEFQELDRDVLPVYQHFVEQGSMSQEAWDYLIEDPIAHTEAPIFPAVRSRTSTREFDKAIQTDCKTLMDANSMFSSQ